MTLKKLWKAVAERILDGDRDEEAIIGWVLGALDDDMSAELVRQTVQKRVRDMLASAVKPTGATSRVPAGQQGFGWLEMEPVMALAKLKRNIRMAYSKMARAAREAQIVGIVDAAIADGLEPSDFASFGEMCAVAGVPDELVEALAA